MTWTLTSQWTPSGTMWSGKSSTREWHHRKYETEKAGDRQTNLVVERQSAKGGQGEESAIQSVAPIPQPTGLRTIQSAHIGGEASSHTMTVMGKRPRGRPKKRWLDRLKDDVRHANIIPEEALDRAKWRRVCRTAVPAPMRDIR